MDDAFTAVPTPDLPAGVPNSGPLLWRMLLPGICSSLGWSVLFQRPYITGAILIAIQGPIELLISFKTLQEIDLIIILDSGGNSFRFLRKIIEAYVQRWQFGQ